MSEFVVGTYNMSWYSGDPTKPVWNSTDQNSFKMPVSEYGWLRYLFDNDSNKKDELIASDDTDRCKYWKNAANHLKKFIEEKNPAMIGLQEMNPNNPNTNLTQNIPNKDAEKWVDKSIGLQERDLGTYAIQVMLESINSQNMNNVYKQLCGEVMSFGALVGICIIYDEKKVGKIDNYKIIDNPKQGGRPLLLAFTDKNYLLASMHGAQTGPLRMNKDGAFDKDILEKNANFFESESVTFLTAIEKEAKAIFLAGDFNDRYDAIKALTVKDITLKYSNLDSDIAPISGCPNWDSAGTGNLHSTKEGFFTSELTDDEIKAKVGDNNTKIALDVDHAKVANYLYRGDKVFGPNPTGNIVTFPSPLSSEGVSICSDHELVYGTFTVEPTMPILAGGRSTRKSKKSKKGGKSKKNGKKGGKKSKRRNY